MGTHKPEDQLLKEIAEARKHIKVGATYQHYKSPEKLYKIEGFTTLEATDELCVIYKALYGPGFTFVRPVSIWLENVEWQGQNVPRFTSVEIK